MTLDWTFGQVKLNIESKGSRRQRMSFMLTARPSPFARHDWQTFL